MQRNHHSAAIDLGYFYAFMYFSTYALTEYEKCSNGDLSSHLCSFIPSAYLALEEYFGTSLKNVALVAAVQVTGLYCGIKFFGNDHADDIAEEDVSSHHANMPA